MLRPYQLRDLNEIKASYSAGIKKLLYFAPTGSGKTVLFCEILKSIHKNKKRAVMITRRRKLVDQASDRLFREKIDHGVFMSNHPMFRPSRPIQVASIDTVNSRRAEFKDLDLIIIDEVHDATSRSYRAFLEKHSETRVLGVTATPYTKQSLRHCADKIISSLSISNLIEQGYLVAPRYFAPVVPNLSRVGIDYKKGDYNTRDLFSVMGEKKIQGDIVRHWKSIGENRPTLCFAVSIEHSKLIEAEFNAAGIACRHIDADSSDLERAQAIRDLESGKLKIITNVGIFCTGVDIPSVSCLILARPTQSYILYIQQMGRGTRSYPGKKDFIVLDHGGNVLRHGFIEDERAGTLDGKIIEPQIKVFQCGKCFAVIQKWPCSECGHEVSVHARGKSERSFEADREAELEEIVFAPEKLTFTHSEIMKDIETFDRVKNEKGFKEGFVWHMTKLRYGEDAAKRYLSHRFKRGPLGSR